MHYTTYICQFCATHVSNYSVTITSVSKFCNLVRTNHDAMRPQHLRHRNVTLLAGKLKGHGSGHGLPDRMLRPAVQHPDNRLVSRERRPVKRGAPHPEPSRPSGRLRSRRVGRQQSLDDGAVPLASLEAAISAVCPRLLAFPSTVWYLRSAFSVRS